MRTLPGCGLVQLHERWAQLLAARFVEQSRFDPLHAAASEQQLYDRLPHWLAALQTADDVATELLSGGAGYHAKLRARDVLEAAMPVYSQIEDAVRRERGVATVLASARFAALPRIEALLPAFTRLDAEAVIHGCLRHAALICSDESALRFVTRLPAGEDATAHADAGTTGLGGTAAPAAMVRAEATVPSHLVVGARALRLDPGSLYLHRDADGWTLSRHMPHAFAGTLTWDGAGWLLVPAPGSALRLDGGAVRAPLPLRAGQRLQPDPETDALRLVAESAVGDDGA